MCQMEPDKQLREASTWLTNITITRVKTSYVACDF